MIMRRTRQASRRAFARAPGLVRGAIVVGLCALLWFVANGFYQLIRKPSELFFPVRGTLDKTPAQTWRTYGSLFRRYSTPLVTPELLAALAQAEGAGNPLAHTYWRWSLTTQPFEVYRPASSSVGMYQITDGTFAQARRYCVRRHTVLEECWFNDLYLRVIPAHAVELTAAYLDRSIANTLARHPGRSVPLERLQELAALIHLCGAGAADPFALNGMRLVRGQRCGEHEVGAYVTRVDRLRRLFRGLQQAEER